MSKLRDEKCQNTRREMSKYETRNVRIRDENCQNTRREMSKYETRNVKRRDEKCQKTRREMTKYETRNVEIRDEKYQNQAKVLMIWMREGQSNHCTNTFPKYPGDYGFDLDLMFLLNHFDKHATYYGGELLRQATTVRV